MTSISPFPKELVPSLLQRDYLGVGVIELCLEFAHLCVGFVDFFINELELHAVLALLLDDSLCLALLRVEDHGNRLHLLLDFMDSLLDLDFFNEVRG